MRLLRLLPLALLAALAACDVVADDSLYDPDNRGTAAPVISQVSPQGLVLAGIDEITISGQNFSATLGENLVFFDDGAGAVERGTVLAASSTELRVKVPNLPNPNLRVRVSVVGAPDFSNAVALPLTPSFVPFGDLDAGIREESASIASDATGTLYFSLAQDGNARGIKRFTPAGVRENAISSPIVWSDLAFGAGTLYGAQGVQALFRLPPSGPAQVLMPVLGNAVRLTAIDTDDTGGLWAGGSAGTPSRPEVPNLYRFDLAGRAVATPFPGVVSDLRVFDGYLYVAAVRSEPTRQAKVWRLPIQADGTLGAEEVVYDVDADTPGLRASAIAIAADGTVFVGIAPPTSNPSLPVANPVIRVAPDGTAAPLYPGVLPSPVQAFAWGAGSELYMVRGRLIQGSGETARSIPSALFKIETRQQGAP
jgi:sugar lactone lactonase YvrE